MGFFKNLIKKFRNRNVQKLPPIQTINFLTSDGMEASLNGIKEITEVTYPNSKTKLYSASLLKGGNGDLGKMDIVCFELPENLPLEQSQACVQYMVSNAYHQINTNDRNDSYYHMGVINYDENGALQMYNPEKNILDWVEKNLNEPLWQRRRYANEVNQANSQRFEEQGRQKIQQSYNANEQYEQNQYAEKVNRFNYPIFEDAIDFEGKRGYRFYQQPDLNDSSKLTGFTTLKNVQSVCTLEHGDGNKGYVYSAHVFNGTEKTAEEFAKIYPKICFELPCPIEEIGQRLQMGDKSIVQTLGQITCEANLASHEVKRNGEQTWMGRIVSAGQGKCYIENRMSEPVRKYIEQENEVVKRMNQSRSSYQSDLGNCDREQY